jgi:hypothetical protein
MQMKPVTDNGWRRILPLAGLALVLVLSWTGLLDGAASRHVDDGLKRAITTFGTARLLNAGLSLAQGTQVQVTPFGLGMTLSVGQLVRPVNELVAQFAELMLAASVAFGAMKLLILIGAHWTVSLALTLCAVAYVAFPWRSQRPHGWLARLLATILLLRFAVPVVTAGSGLVFDTFLHNDYASSQAAMTASGREIDRLSPSVPKATPGQGVIETMKGWAASSSDFVTQGWDRFRNVSGSLPEHIITMIVVFMLQTLVLPLALVWGLIRVTRALVEPRARLSQAA